MMTNPATIVTEANSNKTPQNEVVTRSSQSQSAGSDDVGVNLHLVDKSELQKSTLGSSSSSKKRTRIDANLNNLRIDLVSTAVPNSAANSTAASSTTVASSSEKNQDKPANFSCNHKTSASSLSHSSSSSSSSSLLVTTTAAAANASAAESSLTRLHFTTSTNTNRNKKKLISNLKSGFDGTIAPNNVKSFL